MNILIPLPLNDFDPTETAVPWKHLVDAGHTVTFATPGAKPGQADERMITGRGLLFWSPILRAHKDAREAYDQMTASAAFQNPISWESLTATEADGLILPGGHAPGMKPYLESTDVQDFVLRFFQEQKPIGAICHGVVVVARTIDPATGKSVLSGRETTALTQSMEMSAFAMTGLWLGRYYRTYEQTVEAEVTAACGAELFHAGPFALFKDSPKNLERGFVVRDGHYLSARWPGDAYRFAAEFESMLFANHRHAAKN